jgi:hypothetical protein
MQKKIIKNAQIFKGLHLQLNQINITFKSLRQVSLA